MFKKISLTLLSLAFVLPAHALEKNQFGGYDNVDLLSYNEYQAFSDTPQFKKVVGDLTNKLNQFSQSIEQGNPIVIPELTMEQKSFMRAKEIDSWNKMREIAQIAQKKFDKQNQAVESAQKITGDTSQNNTGNPKSMNEMPEMLGENFVRNEDGVLEYKPKVDLNKLPKFHIPESRCEELNQ